MMSTENNAVNIRPSLSYITCQNLSAQDKGEHRMAYWRWGSESAPRTLLCVHGLTRQGLDFDVMARALVASFKGELTVVAPDIVGRGKSDWLKDPMAYGLPQYASDMVALIKQLNAPALDWFGTSMGGLIAMVTLGSYGCETFQLKHLVLNDVGPALDPVAVSRIGAYVGKAPLFDSVQAGVDYQDKVAASFGARTPEEWYRYSAPMLVPEGDKYRLHYDPRIAEPFNSITPEMAAQGEKIMWSLYDKITCPTLVSRGADSDLLSPATAQAMTQRGAKARLVEFANVGHAPMFIHAEQIAVAEAFLKS